MKFNLTFEVVTEQSAEHGDFARHGFLTRHGELPAGKAHRYIPKNPASFTLAEAIEIFCKFDKGEGPIEADSCPISKTNPPRWFNTCNNRDENNETINVSLHLPREVTGASAMRVAKYLGCYGIRP